ncbi:MAG: putative membrane protein [Candidatus Nomurabacteria bacterium GW2011_GWB1_40_7]|uniref:Putative membrane protein n=1 Tax=Candidatus Nomurabacteria bacterium GW2011_GWB1_40_7 TaxID=1618744 RepID=A0A0G0W618_9BACT|nr:MAG: putative membrane protein [Candidatus Nomurabacteria bacterium GW2011_GWB1_40_7]
MKLFFKKVNKLSKGFTLIETLVAISIFTMSILAMFSVLAQSISDTGYAKKKMTATYLAQEGIEYARNLRDNAVLSGAGWDSFNVDDTINDSPIDNSAFSFIFDRTVTKNKINADEAKIISTVSWTQGSGDYEITFSENLFNWIE